MKIIRLLGALAIFSLIILPACSQPSLKGCICIPDKCHKKAANSGCSQSSDSRISMSCTCSVQSASYLRTEYYDPNYSQFSKNGSRLHARQSLAGLEQYGNTDALCHAQTSTDSNNVGPPDLDALEFLPSSARQIFQVLASDGPMTQKEIISRTDLPPRTVRYALTRLKEENLLLKKFYFQDARQSLYGLNAISSEVITA